ncbi:MAG: PASTA domain-containing protein [Pseudomonadota bacterium]
MLQVRLALLMVVSLLLSACSPTETTVAENPLGVTTPDIAGVEQSAGEQTIRDAGLRIGTVTTQSSDSVPIGSVVRTDPAAGTVVPDGSTINIIVSSGTATVVIPTVAGSTEAAATTLVQDAGLEVAAVLLEASNTTPAEQAVRTIPAAGESLARGAGVTLVMSTGPANVMVPNVVNLPEAQAATDITDATLIVGSITGQASDVVSAGSIIEQTPVGGAMVSANTPVDLVVSLGPANIAVPVLAGLSEAAAIQALTDLGLIVGDITTASSVDFEPGDVITQDPGAGVLVAAGTLVSIEVSVGPNPLPVPNIVGLTEAEANTVIPNAGLDVGNVTRRFDNVIPQFEVISQGTPPGTLVQPDTPLDFVVSQGPPIPTPNIVGATRADAEAALLAANLQVGNVTEANDFNVPEGSVISQDPNGGTLVSEGTAVDFVVSLGPPTVAAPALVGLTEAQATAALDAVSLNVGAITRQNSASVPAGEVISQSPIANTIVIVGSDIDLVVSLGPVLVQVPDLSGLNRADSTSALLAASLMQGTVTSQSSDTVPAGRVISQSPVAGNQVPENSMIDTLVSSGPAVDGFSDEFDVDSLLDWSLRHQVEGAAAQYTVLDINQTTVGGLTIEPLAGVSWLDDADAPFVFKLLAGDFAVLTSIAADSITSPGQAPVPDQNTAGLAARDPAGNGALEQLVMLNVGRQTGAVGSAVRNTVAGVSQDTVDAGANGGELVLCRIGDSLYAFRRLTGETEWLPLATVVRDDLPTELQVGLVANAASATADLRAVFSYIRLLPAPATEADCTP